MHSNWSEKTKILIKELNKELRLNHNNWHKYKNDSNRRSAELIASGLSQLINDGEEKEIEELFTKKE